MKIHITKIKESWIIDRIKKEWIENNKNYTQYPIFSDIIWAIAPWALRKNYFKKNANKKIIGSFYHIEDTSKNSSEIENIKSLDRYLSAYHTISKQTKEVIESFTEKPVYYLPLWVNQDIWYYKENKSELRLQYHFDDSDFLVGSFQRDTEGHDLISPKLIKGPDIFIQIVKQLYIKKQNLKVVLTGKRRGYIISELEKAKIPYMYFEMTNFEMMNDLYNVLDLYLITSRLEGGPQALVECGQVKAPLLSTNVGIASEILHKDSIFDFNDLSSFDGVKVNTDHAFKTSSKLTIPTGMIGYKNMFKEVYEN